MTANDPASSAEPLVCVVGPTAVGKTALAVELAQRFGGEIINADSRQVYRGMTIGTAKPTEEERATAPHHLVDILDLPEPFGLSLFLTHAAEAVRDIRSRGRLSIVCGGTGQYLWALAGGQQVPTGASRPPVSRRPRSRSRAEWPRRPAPAAGGHRPSPRRRHRPAKRPPRHPRP